MKYLQKIKSHLFKVTLSIAATVLLVKYWKHVSLDSQRLEPLFFIDTSKNKMDNIEPQENVTVLEGADAFNFSSSQNSSFESIPFAPFRPVTNPNNQSILCPPVPPNLNGPMKIMTDFKSFEEMEKVYVDLEPGGMFRPKECKARYVVALVIPYRDRFNQLSIFLNNIHRLLQKQQVDYGIFVIEQYGYDPFNRGKLMNVGYAEASKIKNFDCYIFHDVDLIPEDDRNLYTCPEQPRHMSVAVDKFHYKLPYYKIFGGVCALSKEHFKMANGFSNLFWGWGGEDDDMYVRVRRKGLHISRYPPSIARYTMLPHRTQTPNPKRFEVLQESAKMYSKDGLNNLYYKRKKLVFKKLYTWILVDLKAPR